MSISPVAYQTKYDGKPVGKIRKSIAMIPNSLLCNPTTQAYVYNVFQQPAITFYNRYGIFYP